MSEEWRPVVGFEDTHEVSSLGRVRSTRGRGRMLAARPTGNRLRVFLHRRGKRRMRYLHTLVLEAFISPRPEGCIGRHVDDDRTNCRVDNLVWVPATERSPRNGHRSRQVLEALQALGSSSAAELAEHIDVTQTVVHNVLRRIKPRGTVKRVHSRRLSVRGKRIALWSITDAGRTLLDRLGPLHSSAPTSRRRRS